MSASDCQSTEGVKPLWQRLWEAARVSTILLQKKKVITDVTIVVGIHPHWCWVSEWIQKAWWRGDEFWKTIGSSLVQFSVHGHVPLCFNIDGGYRLYLDCLDSEQSPRATLVQRVAVDIVKEGETGSVMLAPSKQEWGEIKAVGYGQKFSLELGEISMILRVMKSSAILEPDGTISFEKLTFSINYRY